VVLAAAFIAIGLIHTESDSQFMLYHSFSSHGMVFILYTVFAPLGHLNLPTAFWKVLYYIVALGYMMLLTLPVYFYIRRRRSWLIGLQLVAILIHAVIAVFIITPWLIKTFPIPG